MLQLTNLSRLAIIESTHLCNELIVLQLLPALHDPHDARLDLVLPVLVNLQTVAMNETLTLCVV